MARSAYAKLLNREKRREMPLVEGPHKKTQQRFQCIYNGSALRENGQHSTSL
jgi:hypothetical protein